MPRLPEPRGPLSAFLAERLRGEPGPLGPAPRAEDDALAGEDFHLSLYVLYELHYRGFDQVDDDWEWEPSALAVRAALERRLERRLREEVDGPPPPGRDVAERLAAVLEEAPDTGFGRHLQREATLAQFREFVVHRSAYQLKENDPHSWALPRLDGRPKVALAEIQSDEFGGGRPERLHPKLFGDTMAALGLDRRYGAYLDHIPGRTLATVNVMSLFGLHRRLRGAIVGHLAMLEMDSSLPNRRYGDGLRRLGFGEEATDFYDEHVEADAVHEAIAAHDLAGSLAADDPATAGDIIFGARALVLVDGLLTGGLLEDWRAGRTSLLRPLPEDVAAPVAR
ncbi:iron-containing redox enzyme family protein [Miltoncostaea marina]|uniref:iron-containing redox enzyme family protein n=1 Tax=Miltoncostaea marina TaxID=2843215 RepID=UPI001C3C738C|nr:iron-containing redox enzyme family protein [Miltoncostaea marina]